MKHLRILFALLILALLLPSCALCAEGEALLSVDDLLTLEESYGAFLDRLEALIVERGLLSEDDREAWHDAQMGDFFQNGGYGSILANYLPGSLSYVREEDTLITLRAALSEGLTLEINAMRRYTPLDSSLPGLMLTMTVLHADGTPVDAQFTLASTSGIFLKWDALANAYADVGVTASSEGETVVWSDQTPAAEARGPVITIAVTDSATQESLPSASLFLAVDADGYFVSDDALKPAP